MLSTINIKYNKEEGMCEKMKKNTKRIIGVLLGIIVVMIMLYAALSHDQNSLNKSNINLYIGEHYQLKLQKNENKITWTSNHTNIVDVDTNGKIVAKKAGNAVVRATTSKKTYQCKVQVLKRPRLSDENIILKAGQSKKLKLLNTNKQPKWSVENETIVKVNTEGNVKALTAGETRVKASLDQHTYTCSVSVVDAKTTISIGHWENDYYLGEQELRLDYCFLVLTDENNKKSTVPITKEMCSGYNLQKVGQQNVTIQYLGEKITQTIRVHDLNLLPNKASEIQMVNGETRSITLALPSQLKVKQGTLNSTSSASNFVDCVSTNATITLRAHKAGEAYINIDHKQTQKQYTIHVYVSPALYKINNADDSIGIPINQSIELNIQAFRDYQVDYDHNILQVNHNNRQLFVKGIRKGLTTLNVKDVLSQEVLTYHIHVDQDVVICDRSTCIDIYQNKLLDLNSLKSNNGILHIYSTQEYNLNDFNQFTFDQEDKHLGGFYLEDMLLRVKSLKIIHQKNFIEYIIEMDHDYWDYDMRMAYEQRLESIYQSLQLNGLSDEAKVKKIHDYICKNVDYDYQTYRRNIDGVRIDYGIDNYSSYDVLFDTEDQATGAKYVVCTGYAGLFLRLAKKANVDVKLVTGKAYGALATNHVWNIVKINGQWYQIDCTWDGLTQDITYDYYLKGQVFSHHELDEAYSHLPISQNNYA